MHPAILVLGGVVLAVALLCLTAVLCAPDLERMDVDRL
jgi:hypothetical protein